MSFSLDRYSNRAVFVGVLLLLSLAATVVAGDGPPKRPPPPPPPRPPRLKSQCSDTALGVVTTKKNISTSSSSSSTSTINNAIVDNNINNNTTKKVSYVEVMETEVWDAEKEDWLGAYPNRWTKIDGTTACSSPTQTIPPPGTTFVGKWKIVTNNTTRRDSYGWEYLFMTDGEHPQPKRKRVWLRTLEKQQQVEQQQQVPPPQKQQSEQQTANTKVSEIAAKQKQKEPYISTSSAAASSSSKVNKPLIGAADRSQIMQDQVQIKSRTKALVPPPVSVASSSVSASSTSITKATTRQQRKLWPRSSISNNALFSSISSITKAVHDDFNFKGFGMQFSKSLVFPKSFGIIFSCPLTLNFNWVESHPSIPSISTSMGFFLPSGLLNLNVSTSIRVEIIKCILTNAIQYSQFTFLMTIYTIIYHIIWPIMQSTIITPANKIKQALQFLDKPKNNHPRKATTAFVSNDIYNRDIHHNCDSNNKQSVTMMDSSSISGSSLHRTSSGSATSVTHSSYNHRNDPPVLPKIQAVKFSSTLSERIGISVNWRFSLQEGYEFRISYWYSYLPTLASVMDHLKKYQEEHEEETSLSTKIWKPLLQKPISWIKVPIRYPASVGVSAFYPVMSPPYFGSSANLLLSGFRPKIFNPNSSTGGSGLFRIGGSNNKQNSNNLSTSSSRKESTTSMIDDDDDKDLTLNQVKDNKSKTSATQKLNQKEKDDNKVRA